MGGDAGRIGFGQAKNAHINFELENQMIDFGELNETLQGATGDDALHLARQLHQLLHVCRRFCAALTVLVGAGRQKIHRLLGRRRVLENVGDQRFNLLGRFRRPLGQFPDLIRHDREASPGFTGTRRFDRGIQGQQIRLVGNFMNQLNNRTDLISLLGKGFHLFRGDCGIFGQAMQISGNLGRGLAAGNRYFGRFNRLVSLNLQHIGHLAQTLLRARQRFTELAQMNQDRFQRLTLPILLDR